jgi:hypothetical protein
MLHTATAELGKLALLQINTNNKNKAVYKEQSDLLNWGQKIDAVVLLNNVFHVLLVWRRTRIPPTGLEGENLHQSSRDAGCGHNHLDSPPQSFSGVAAAEPTDGVPSGSSSMAADLSTTDDFAALVEVLARTRALFVEQALRAVFPALTAELDDTSPSPSSSSAPPLVCATASVVAAAQEFASKWREGIATLHRDVVLRYVAHPDCQRECLAALSSQLLLYSTRLHQATSGVRGALPETAVSLPVLMQYVSSVFRV